MSFVTTQENDQAIVVKEVRRLKLRWNDDAPDSETFETVYVVLDEPDKELLVFYLLEETPDGRLGFSGRPFQGVIDGDIFPKRLGPFAPIMRKVENMNVHRARMTAIGVLLNAEYNYKRRTGSI